MEYLLNFYCLESINRNSSPGSGIFIHGSSLSEWWIAASIPLSALLPSAMSDGIYYVNWKFSILSNKVVGTLLVLKFEVALHWQSEERASEGVCEKETGDAARRVASFFRIPSSGSLFSDARGEATPGPAPGSASVCGIVLNWLLAIESAIQRVMICL